MSYSTFVIPDDIKMQYAGLYLLKEILEGNYVFSNEPEEIEEELVPIFDWLLEVDYIFVDDHSEYQMTDRGLSILTSFLERYAAFLNEYDIFCGVDLKEVDFALKYFDKFEDSSDWYAFLSHEKWEDLRIAIAEYKGLDAIEIVYMSFINENRFGRDEEGWKHDLLLGRIWFEIQMICNSAIRLKTLSQEKGGVTIPGEKVLQEILDKGARVMEELRSET